MKRGERIAADEAGFAVRFPGRRETAVAALVLGALVGLLYGRTLHFGFAYFDDVDYVTSAAPVAGGLTRDGIAWAFHALYMTNWHPLTWLSYMLDVELFGAAPGAMHGVNAALHAANAWLVFSLARALRQGPAAALFVAAVFAVHPQHVESVAWIAERKDVLFTLFFLAAARAWLWYGARPSLPRLVPVVLLGALSMMSKPMAVTLPLVLLLLDFWPLGRDGARLLWTAPWHAVRSAGVLRLVLEKLPLILGAAGLAATTVVAQQRALVSDAQLDLAQRLLNAVQALAVYLRNVLFPHDLAAIYPIRLHHFDVAVVSCMLLLGVLTIGALRLARARPWLLFGWLWFLVTLLPVIGIVQAGAQSHADRYMYLPSVGLLLALGQELTRLQPAAVRIARFVLGAWFAYLCAMCWVQIGYWATPFLVFQRVVDVSGPVYTASVALSGVYLRAGDTDGAARHAREAMELAPHGPLGYAAMGNVALADGDAVSAEQLYRMAIERSGHRALLYLYLGIALERQGRIEEARDSYRRSLAMEPERSETRAALQRLGG